MQDINIFLSSILSSELNNCPDHGCPGFFRHQINLRENALFKGYDGDRWFFSHLRTDAFTGFVKFY
jgi:hypothetical protein